MVTDVNQTCDHFAIYPNWKLCCTPEINVMLNVDYTSQLKEKKGNAFWRGDDKSWVPCR